MVHKSTSDEHKNLLLKDITESLDGINISCDQITFNPLHETVTITACKLKSGLHNSNRNIHQYNNPNDNETTSLVITSDQDEYDWSNDTSVGDVICLGSIVMLIVIWLSVFIFYFPVFSVFP